ncbi:hypothetical protein AK812_SmicGene3669 [Symbiodinium microadriaticum]|uniref:Uncharacterized protein n=1 Tax=Symbiodinium microadriaticum TaxID=2951 RepID=A0A1Q9EYJ4_SYMMI|nr:hypothetical protein AK812_SmicGene3669 [Symbiodinium microadriaticum]
MRGPPHPPSRDADSLASMPEDQRCLSERTLRSMEWFYNIILRFFCWQFRRDYLESTLVRPSRSVSASMAAWGRTQGEMHATEVLERTTAHLGAAAADTLRRDFEWLNTLLRRQPADNDRAWILTTGNQFSPGKHLLQQKLWPYVVSRLQQCLAGNLLQEVAETIFNMASALWYQDYLMVLLPWLTSEEQLQFQQWFQEYERQCFLALPAAETTDLPEDVDMGVYMVRRTQDGLHLAVSKAMCQARKRAFKRAQARVLREGTTVYRGRKALPPGHVPAVLWKLAGVGRLQLPETWNHTYLVLIAKAPPRCTTTMLLPLLMGRSRREEVSAASLTMDLLPAVMEASAASQLAEAKAELADFGHLMGTHKLQPPSPEEGSTPVPSTAPSETAPPTGLQEMELDKDKRRARQEAEEDCRDKPKWARNDAKGADKGEDRHSGKGHAAQPLQAASPAQGHGYNDRAQGGQRGHNASKNSGQRQQYRQWPRREDNRREDNRDRQWERSGRKDELKEIVGAIGRLVLRLEDTQAVTNLDNEFVVFLQTSATGNPWSITDSLYGVACDWHGKKEKDPTSLSQPMRNVLLFCMLKSLQDQLEALESNAAMCERARTMGLVEGTSYLFLQWNSTLKKHEKATQEPLEHKTAIEIVRQLVLLTAYPNVVGRFHATRRLSDNMESEIIPFTLVLQNRSAESQRFHALFSRLARNSCWHLIGSTMRPSKLGRSALAQLLEKLLRQL